MNDSAVGLNCASGSEDSGLSSVLIAECCHDHLSSAVSCKGEIDHLVVHDIVVAAVNAASVWTFAECLEDAFWCHVAGQDGGWPVAVSLVNAVAKVNLKCRIGAVHLNARRAVRATVGGSRWAGINSNGT